MNKPGALEFQNVVKTYPGEPPVRAVDNVSFALPRGAFAAFIGPSGSGKTTLLNLASGLDRANSGTIRVAGQALNSLGQKELSLFRRFHVGFVFQAYNLFPVLTVRENVEFTSVLRGDSTPQIRSRSRTALESVDLTQLADRYPSQLSGGQQQRVAVARALVTQPDIVFADEPTANLDSKTAMSLIQLMETINKTTGTTFVFSTHDHRLVDRVSAAIQVKDGQITF